MATSLPTTATCWMSEAQPSGPTSGGDSKGTTEAEEKKLSGPALAAPALAAPALAAPALAAPALAAPALAATALAATALAGPSVRNEDEDPAGSALDTDQQ